MHCPSSNTTVDVVLPSRASEAPACMRRILEYSRISAHVHLETPLNICCSIEIHLLTSLSTPELPEWRSEDAGAHSNLQSLLLLTWIQLSLSFIICTLITSRCFPQ